MKPQEAVLNIAVNLGRIARYLEENKPNRAIVFLEDNKRYIACIKTDKLPPNIKRSFEKVLELSNKIQKNNPIDIAEDFYTYANILTHRAYLFNP